MKCAPVAQVLLCSDRASRKCSLGASTRLINAAFILPLWGKMEAVQKDCWYFVVLIFLPFLKGMGFIFSFKYISLNLQCLFFNWKQCCNKYFY